MQNGESQRCTLAEVSHAAGRDSLFDGSKPKKLPCGHIFHIARFQDKTQCNSVCARCSVCVGSASCHCIGRDILSILVNYKFGPMHVDAFAAHRLVLAVETVNQEAAKASTLLVCFSFNGDHRPSVPHQGLLEIMACHAASAFLGLSSKWTTEGIPILNWEKSDTWQPLCCENLSSSWQSFGCWIFVVWSSEDSALIGTIGDIHSLSLNQPMPHSLSYCFRFVLCVEQRFLQMGLY